jgi:hypothetical protein
MCLRCAIEDALAAARILVDLCDLTAIHPPGWRCSCERTPPVAHVPFSSAYRSAATGAVPQSPVASPRQRVAGRWGGDAAPAFAWVELHANRSAEDCPPL